MKIALLNFTKKHVPWVTRMPASNGSVWRPIVRERGELSPVQARSYKSVFLEKARSTATPSWRLIRQLEWCCCLIGLPVPIARDLPPRCDRGHASPNDQRHIEHSGEVCAHSGRAALRSHGRSNGV